MTKFETDKKNLAGRIRLARGTKTQLEFAQALGVHKNTIGKWERGEAEPDLRSASQLCAQYGISAYWLLNGSGVMFDSDRDIKAHMEPNTKAGNLRDYKLSEINGGPEFDATLARLQGRIAQLEQERDEARAAELRAKDEALKAKDEALEAMRELAGKSRAKTGSSIDDEPPTDRAQMAFLMQHKK